MLVLSRKMSERIYITLPDGTRGSVLVVSATGKVRLGFDCPANWKIDRDDYIDGPSKTDTSKGGKS